MRFQFIQNEIVRVRADDVLGIQVHNSDCRSNIVSTHPRNGPSTISLSAHIGYEINETRTFDRSHTYYSRDRPASPSLKAYISGICLSMYMILEKKTSLSFKKLSYDVLLILYYHSAGHSPESKKVIY